MYANRGTLNIADLKQAKPLPPRPKPEAIKPINEPNILRNDSKTNWSDASSFHYQPSPDPDASLTQQFFNHDYEENASVNQSLPKQR